jgi:hypothetical protein
MLNQALGLVSFHFVWHTQDHFLHIADSSITGKGMLCRFTL